MFKILEIAILRSETTNDIIVLKTDLPECIQYPSPTKLRFECIKGTGEDYVKTNFPGIPYEVR